MAADAVFAVQALCKNDEKEGTHRAIAPLNFYLKLVIAGSPCSLDLRNQYFRNFINGAEEASVFATLQQYQTKLAHKPPDHAFSLRTFFEIQFRLHVFVGL